MKPNREQRSDRGDATPNAERLAAVYQRPEYQSLQIPRVSGVRLAPWLGLLFGLIGGALGGLLASGLATDCAGIWQPGGGATVWPRLPFRGSASSNATETSAMPQRDRSLAGVYLTKTPSAKAKLVDQLYGTDDLLATATVVTADGWLALPVAALPDQRASYTVLTADRRLLTVQGRQDDLVTGLAFIKVNAADLAAVDFAAADRLNAGQTVFAVQADPGGTHFPVQALRLLQISAGAAGITSTEQIDRWLTAVPALTAAWPGAALLNDQGEVAGVLIDPEHNRWLPGAALKQAVANFLKEKHAYGTYAGLRYLDISLHRGVAKVLPLKQSGGALVIDEGNLLGVIPGSPAAVAGMTQGDVILKLNGEAVNADRSLAMIIQEYQPDDVVTLGILRNGESLVFPLRLGRWPLKVAVDKSKGAK